MSRRGLFYVYLVAVHAIFAGGIIYLLRDHGYVVLGVEVVVGISFWLGLRLIRSTFEPLEILQAGVDLLQSKDFASRFHESGNPEMDSLVRVYNRMADELREERIRNEEQEHFLRKILETRTTAVLTFDLDGKIASINPGAAALLDVNAAQSLERALTDLRSPFAHSLDELAPGETKVLPLHGPRRVRCHRGSFYDRGFAREFFVLEELTDELRRSEKAAYEKLIRVMSHEVNNTAGGVTSLLDSCLNYADQIGADDREDYRDAIRVASARTTRLNEFVRGFADVIRLPKPSKAPMLAAELIEPLRTLLRDECAKRNIRWISKGESEVGDIEVDAPQMEQALLNIVRNAIDAIGSDGELQIRWEQNSGRAALEIEDTGGGIPPEVRPHLFAPFFTSKDDGQGIGLTLVQEILIAHEFEFSLQDSDRGGAVFRIEF